MLLRFHTLLSSPLPCCLLGPPVPWLPTRCASWRHHRRRGNGDLGVFIPDSQHFCPFLLGQGVAKTLTSKCSPSSHICSGPTLTKTAGRWDGLGHPGKEQGEDKVNRKSNLVHAEMLHHHTWMQAPRGLPDYSFLRLPGDCVYFESSNFTLWRPLEQKKKALGSGSALTLPLTTSSLLCASISVPVKWG